MGLLSYLQPTEVQQEKNGRPKINNNKKVTHLNYVNYGNKFNDIPNMFLQLSETFGSRQNFTYWSMVHVVRISNNKFK